MHAERWAAWVSGRAHVAKKRAGENVEDLRARVLAGEVDKTQIMLTDEYFETYSHNVRLIEEALEAYGERRGAKAAMSLQRGEFSTAVYYIHGKAGAGKTRFAKEFIDRLVEFAADQGQKWSLYRAATGNPLDDWKGQEIVLLDDLRASAMDANDWLLLLDPHNASPARARYRNKQAVAPRCIILTATIEPIEFFFYARKKGEAAEALDQFLRRLQSIVKVLRVDDDAFFDVSQPTRVEPYLHAVVTPTEVARFELEFAINQDAVRHTLEGAFSTLMLGVAKHSPDVAFADRGEWPALEALVANETHEAAQQKQLEELERELAEARAAVACAG